ARTEEAGVETLPKHLCNVLLQRFHGRLCQSGRFGPICRIGVAEFPPIGSSPLAINLYVPHPDQIPPFSPAPWRRSSSRECTKTVTALLGRTLRIGTVILFTRPAEFVDRLLSF